MSSKGASSQDRRLWQRWLALCGTPQAAEPDALSLAAYAEGRLSEAEAEAVEAWLAVSPDGLDDIIAAREERPPRLVYQHILNHACDLIPGPATALAAEPETAAILPFRRRMVPQLRTALAWSSIAASLVCASTVGFSMGSAAYANLSGAQTVDSGSADGLYTPSSLDSYFSDDTGT
jgi:hypothetical protein